MDTIFGNFENSKISDPKRLLPDFQDKINKKKEVTNIFLYQTLAFTIHGKI